MNADTLAGLGAFAFGAVIGWLVYFTNRYRTGSVQFSDITTLLGAIGAGAVTALFEPKGQLFGAYGLGLFIGFFAYFVMLVILVRNSNGIFTWTWFLDGRRKQLAGDEVVDPSSRGSGTAMDVQPQRDLGQALAPAAEPSPLTKVTEQHDRALASLNDAIRDLTARVATASDAERAVLEARRDDLRAQRETVANMRLAGVLDSPEVRAAIVTLKALTDQLNEEVQRIKQVADAVDQAARVIGQVTKVIAALGKFLV
jgi:hypothetical protein